MSEIVKLRAGKRVFKSERAFVQAVVDVAGHPRAPILVRGCWRCSLVCADARPELRIPDHRCTCCKNYGKKSAGGNRAYFKFDPLDPLSKSNQPGHSTICSVAQLAEKIESEAAA